MAFPNIVSSEVSYQAEDTSHSITMPATISVGNLLVVFFTCSTDAVSVSINTSISGNNWRELIEYSSTSNTASCYYKVAESSNILTLTTSSLATSSSIAYNISGSSRVAPIINHAEGSLANANPPNIIPNNGTQDYLFLVYAGIYGSIIASAAPTNFTGLVTAENDPTGASSSAAYRQYNTGSSYDPGAFTSAAGYWVAFTICISPYGIDGVDIGYFGYVN